MKTELVLSCRHELKFSASDLGSDRTHESFSILSPQKKLLALTLETARKSFDFLEPQFHPRQLFIDLEYDGEMTFEDGAVEQIPLSLITSQQQPSRSRIRIGMHEIGTDAEAYVSILAHELGHMLPEWNLRVSGLVSASDVVIPFWSKAVYEGIADWFSCVISGSTLIGSNSLWFKRDILKYQSLEESKNSVGQMADTINRGLNQADLIPKYRAYNE